MFRLDLGELTVNLISCTILITLHMAYPEYRGRPAVTVHCGGESTVRGNSEYYHTADHGMLGSTHQAILQHQLGVL